MHIQFCGESIITYCRCEKVLANGGSVDITYYFRDSCSELETHGILEKTLLPPIIVIMRLHAIPAVFIVSKMEIQQIRSIYNGASKCTFSCNLVSMHI